MIGIGRRMGLRQISDGGNFVPRVGRFILVEPHGTFLKTYNDGSIHPMFLRSSREKSVICQTSRGDRPKIRATAPREHGGGPVRGLATGFRGNPAHGKGRVASETALTGPVHLGKGEAVMGWLFPAVVASCGATLLQVIAYLWLWSEERKQFLGTWALAWAFYLARFVASLMELAYGTHPLYVIVESGCTLICAVLLLHGLYQFLQKPMRRVWYYIAAAAIAWVIYGGVNHLRFLWVSTPVFLLTGAIFVATGVVILRAKELAGVGRPLMGWTFIVWGIHKFDFPILRPLEWIAPWGFLLGALLAIMASMGMILIYFRYAKDLLTQNEERLRFLSNNIPNGAFFQHILKLDGQISYTYMSDGIESIFGVSASEAVTDARKLRRLIVEEDLVGLRKAEAESLANLSVLKLEFRQRARSGELKWVQCHSAPQHLRTGETVWNGFFVDITERKVAEQALRESEEKYRVLVDHLPVGVFATDVNGSFLHANPAIATMAGYDSVEEFMALSTAQLYHDLADRERLLKMLLDSGSVRNETIRSAKKNGTVYWVRLNAELLSDETGKPAWIHGIVENITDRKLAQDALRASEERFRLLFEQCPLGMTLTGLDFRFMMANPHLCQMVGYTEHELTAMTFKDITHPDDLAAGVQAVNDLVNGVILDYEAEKRYIRKDGQSIWINLVVAPVRDNAGKVLHFLTMIQDISERKRAEAERLRLVAAIEHAAETIEITDEHGTVLYVNPAFERTSGYSRDEAIGEKSSTLERGKREARPLDRCGKRSRRVAHGPDIW
jgi:PAS domain S-box-containing protein